MYRRDSTLLPVRLSVFFILWLLITWFVGLYMGECFLFVVDPTDSEKTPKDTKDLSKVRLLQPLHTIMMFSALSYFVFSCCPVALQRSCGSDVNLTSSLLTQINTSDQVFFLRALLTRRHVTSSHLLLLLLFVSHPSEYQSCAWSSRPAVLF